MPTTNSAADRNKQTVIEASMANLIHMNGHEPPQLTDGSVRVAELDRVAGRRRRVGLRC